MSWIFREPFDPAIYAGRRVGTAPTPNLARPFSSRGRLTATLVALDPHEDADRDTIWLTQRRTFAPIPATAGASGYSPAGRILASLLAAGMFDEPVPHTAPTRFVVGIAPGDKGLSASATMTFIGTNPNPVSGEGLAASLSQGLCAQSLTILEITPPISFGGVTASRVV